MSIDSTQLSNILNSLELTIEGDSFSQMQYQPLIDTLNNGIVVQTDWWLFGVIALNSIAITALVGVLISKNIKYKKMDPFKCIYKSPIAIAVFYGLIALTLFCITKNFDIFFAVIGIGISVLLLITAMQQNLIQKDNIKLQLFDKRYKVFKAVVDARSLLNREDHIMTGLYNASHLNNMGSQMTDTYNTLRDSFFISQTLFDKDIFEKMNRILSLFNNTRKSFYQLGIAGLGYVELIKKNELKIQQILVMHADNIEQMNIELNKIIPDFAEILKPWQASVVEFNDYLESSGIQKDFDSYLMVHNIDK